MVLTFSIEVPRPDAGRWPCPSAHLAPHLHDPPSSHAAYSAWGWGHGNTQYSNTSHRVHTQSISPARISFQKIWFSYDQPSSGWLLSRICKVRGRTTGRVNRWIGHF